MVLTDNIARFQTTLFENERLLRTTLRENETTLIENRPTTLSRVGLRCRECDFRLRRPRRLTRRLDEAYAWRCLTHGKSTVSDGLGQQQRRDGGSVLPQQQ